MFMCWSICEKLSEDCFCVCIRKTGCGSRDFLWLLLCASIFRTVRTILGTQCKGVRIWQNTLFAGSLQVFSLVLPSMCNGSFCPLMCLWYVVPSSNYYVSLLYLIWSKLISRERKKDLLAQLLSPFSETPKSKGARDSENFWDTLCVLQDKYNMVALFLPLTRSAIFCTHVSDSERIFILPKRKRRSAHVWAFKQQK